MYALQCLLGGNLSTDGTHQTIQRLGRMGDDERYRLTYERKSPKPLKQRIFPFLSIAGWFVRAVGRHGKTNMEDGQWEIKDKWSLKALEVEQIGYNTRRTSKMGNKIIKIVWVVKSKMCASFVTFCFRDCCKMEDNSIRVNLIIHIFLRISANL